MNELLTAALIYQKRAFSVIPIQPGEKKPLFAWEEYQSRRATEEEIKPWWLKWPEANVGIVTGSVSGLIAVDVDSIEAKDKLKGLLSDYDLSAVPRSRTGKGWQLFFKHPGVTVPNRAGIIPGLDVRGDGGYVVAPPSVHPSGKVYKWEVPINGELPKLPVELFKLISSPTGNGLQSSAKAEPVGERIKAGERNSTLASLAGTMRRRGMGEDAILAALLKENESKCDPPLPEREVERIAKSVARYEPTGETPENLTSALKGEAAEVRLEREINAATLQAKARDSQGAILTFLPVLGADELIVKGWSHLLASYSKTGKTELMTRLIASWTGEKILYFTEEAESIWLARFKKLEPLSLALGHVTLLFAMGLKTSGLLERIKNASETIVVLDTVRNLLGLRDETDNSEVARAMLPFVAACQRDKKTLICLHHDRKGGGEHGEGITGGHAFLGAVDIALELKRDATDRRRLLRGWGRVIEIPSVMYELVGDGSMAVLGSPADVALGEVKDRLLVVLADEFKKTKEVTDALGEPRPSPDTVTRALNALAKEGQVDRDPPLEKGQVPGAHYRWRMAQNLPPQPPSYSGGEVEDGQKGWEEVLSEPS
ncbi:MAG: bifunctional DNA primase/polymerase [Deltaproteobacteria bacterium]|nr:bifunctional DNA primase/polymerase [Deltaproteobacteria bacterium]